MRKHDWFALPGRDDQSEAFLELCREQVKSPEALTRLCRIAIRRYLCELTGDRDIRKRLKALPIPVMLYRFLNLTEETKLYLERGADLEQPYSAPDLSIDM